ncbi:MAG: acyl-CoA/acyl-ACP dehydrogenase, partial [Coriobacteriia bacterium]|nr:acyl-CoA/acyl-ACP dehydrogenase [Coriobacteriia bacterium]
MKRYYLDLTDEQQLIMNMIHDFGQNVVAPRADEIDRSNEFPMDIFEKAAELGFTMFLFPEEHGGAGQNDKIILLMQEELAQFSPSVGFVLNYLVKAMGIFSLVPELAAKYAEDLQKGRTVAAFAVADPIGSFNYSQHPVFARKEGDEWVLNGTRLFVTATGIAKLILSHGLCDDGQFRYFAVEAGVPGFETTKIEQKIGLNGINNGVLSYQNVRVPDSSVLPFPSVSDTVLSGYNGSYLEAAAVAVGGAQGVFDKTLDYIKTRESHGITFDKMSFHADRMGRLASRIDVCRCYLHRTIEDFVNQTITPEQGHIIKAESVNMFIDVAKECIESWG